MSVMKSLWVGAIAAGLSSSLHAAENIAICEDGAEWPPFHYIKRDGGQKVPGVSEGYSIDVINKILKGSQFSYSKVDFIPWKRCLKQLLKGKYDLVMNASYNAERAANFLYTKAYYKMRPAYFYSLKKHPNGLEGITSGAALSKYKVCGLAGYNYKAFNIDLSQLDTGSKNFASVAKKVRAGRCDAFIARIEALAGFKAIGQDFLQDDIGYQPIPGAKANEFYMIISKKSKHAKALQEKIDQGIDKLKADGELKILLDKYLK
ncbi:substrate-binding periplasmic protein [Piscirickettsia salmonis]|uniref:substrate-binding periplasmic protein n=1 Tax=Piscirickettsia salmonis TaxID=1238 RepID=UPI00374FF36B